MIAGTRTRTRPGPAYMIQGSLQHLMRVINVKIEKHILGTWQSLFHRYDVGDLTLILGLHGTDVDKFSDNS